MASDRFSIEPACAATTEFTQCWIWTDAGTESELDIRERRRVGLFREALSHDQKALWTIVPYFAFL